MLAFMVTAKNGVRRTPRTKAADPQIPESSEPKGWTIPLRPVDERDPSEDERWTGGTGRVAPPMLAKLTPFVHRCLEAEPAGNYGSEAGCAFLSYRCCSWRPAAISVLRES